jgi:gluconate 5-dehydrogenase
MELFSLKGRRALVTGSSQGLGLAMAEGLGKAGATVILNGRNVKKLERARQKLQRKKIKTRTCAFDVTDEAAVVEGVRRIEKDVGAIDILVNNAGMNLRALIEEFPTDQWHELMDLNVNGVFYVSKAVGKRMVRRKRGKVVNILSLMSAGARPTTAPYAASKGAIAMFTKALATEWGKYNIQVNAVGPGYFATAMTRPLVEDKKFDAWVRAETPAGRWGKPTELTGAVVFFASKASHFVTGQILYVDGGWLAAL